MELEEEKVIQNLEPLVKELQEKTRMCNGGYEFEIRLGNMKGTSFQAGVDEQFFQTLLRSLEACPDVLSATDVAEEHIAYFFLSNSREARTIRRFTRPSTPSSELPTGDEDVEMEKPTNCKSVLDLRTFRAIHSSDRRSGGRSHDHHQPSSSSSSGPIFYPYDVRVQLSREDKVADVFKPLYVTPSRVVTRQRRSFFLGSEMSKVGGKLPRDLAVWSVDMSTLWVGATKRQVDLKQRETRMEYHVEIELLEPHLYCSAYTPREVAENVLVKIRAIMTACTGLRGFHCIDGLLSNNEYVRTVTQTQGLLFRRTQNSLPVTVTVVACAKGLLRILDPPDWWFVPYHAVPLRCVNGEDPLWLMICQRVPRVPYIRSGPSWPAPLGARVLLWPVLIVLCPTRPQVADIPLAEDPKPNFHVPQQWHRHSFDLLQNSISPQIISHLLALSPSLGSFSPEDFLSLAHQRNPPLSSGMLLTPICWPTVFDLLLRQAQDLQQIQKPIPLTPMVPPKPQILPGDPLDVPLVPLHIREAAKRRVATSSPSLFSASAVTPMLASKTETEISSSSSTQFPGVPDDEVDSDFEDELNNEEPEGEGETLELDPLEEVEVEEDEGDEEEGDQDEEDDLDEDEEEEDDEDEEEEEDLARDDDKE